jgi:hypothetical protein
MDARLCEKSEAGGAPAKVVPAASPEVVQLARRWESKSAEVQIV